MGKSMREKIEDSELSVKDYKYIEKTLKYILPKFNKVDIYHADIHPGNIFYKNKKVYLADWANPKPSIGRDTLTRMYYSYYQLLKYDIYLSYILKQKGIKEIENHLKEVNLYDKFINSVEEMFNKELIASPYKPKEFMKRNYLVIYRMKLGKILISDDKSGYVYEETKLPKGLADYMKYVEKMIPSKKKKARK
jgi:hypothetical protein